MIVVGYDRSELNSLFATITDAGAVSNSYGIANYESGGHIWICTAPRRPLWQLWPGLKTLD